jgi:hypothetical protein
MVPIAGTVTIDGQPAQFVRVIFAKPKDVADFKIRKRRVVDGPGGMTDEQGAFSVTSIHANDGLIPGEYTVIFDWIPQGMDIELFNDNEPTEEQLKGLPKELMSIHNKYAAGGTETDKFSFKVEAKKPQKDLKFELTSK